jgi:hypothetical protein
MTRLEFKEATKKCFKDYGFVIRQNKFFLELEDIVMLVKLYKSGFGDYYYLDWNCAIREIHKGENLLLLSEFKYDLFLFPRFCIAKGRAFEIHYEYLEKEKYISVLERLIPIHCDPIINGGISYLKKYEDQFHFQNGAKEYLANWKL